MTGWGIGSCTGRCWKVIKEIQAKTLLALVKGPDDWCGLYHICRWKPKSGSPAAP
jgi:hypothetical protein